MKKSRWVKGILWSVSLVAIAGVVLWYIPTNYIVIAPGITGDLSQMIKVKGGHPPGVKGKLLMVAVTVARANELVYLGSKLDPNVETMKSQTAMGGMTMKQYQKFNVQLMKQSQLSAEVVGEKLAGLKAGVNVLPGAMVVAVVKGTPAQGKLIPGDEILKVGSYPVKTLTQIHTILKQHYKYGEIVPFTVKHDGQSKIIPIKTTHIAHDSAPGIGVEIAPIIKPRIPVPVQVKAGSIGGPSAGMMFSLEIYEQITGKNLSKGHIVAGTGEIYPNGSVGPIGGVAQKVITVHRAGAKVFLCPAQNYPKAERMAKKKGYHLKIYPVSTVYQALHDLQRLK